MTGYLLYEGKVYEALEVEEGFLLLESGILIRVEKGTVLVESFVRPLAA